jgi:alkylation response protein AidB-like acyl-CoA dehydrogenase
MSQRAALVTGSARILRDEVRAFLRQEHSAGRFTPQVDGWVSGFDTGFSRELGARGWIGMTIPGENGGPGRSALERFVVTEELLAAGAPVAAHWISDRQIVPSLVRNGTAAQRARYLPVIAAGRCFFCLGMSEPEAGSDLAAVRMRAVFEDGRWVLNGTKLWTTHAQYAHAMLLLARSRPAADERHAGLSQFLIDLPHPGVSVRPIGTIDGGAHFNEVVFTDAMLPPEALLGVEGNGWSQITAELAYERSGPERFMSTVPLLLTWGDRLRDGPSQPAAEAEFARLVSRLSVLRRMSFAIAVALEAGEIPDTDAALVKERGGPFEQDVVETVARWSGTEPHASSRDLLARQLAAGLTHAPTFTIRGGSSDILSGIVARQLGVR